MLKVIRKKGFLQTFVVDLMVLSFFVVFGKNIMCQK